MSLISTFVVCFLTLFWNISAVMLSTCKDFQDVIKAHNIWKRIIYATFLNGSSLNFQGEQTRLSWDSSTSYSMKVKKFPSKLSSLFLRGVFPILSVFKQRQDIKAPDELLSKWNKTSIKRKLCLSDDEDLVFKLAGMKLNLF